MRIAGAIYREAVVPTRGQLKFILRVHSKVFLQAPQKLQEILRLRDYESPSEEHDNGQTNFVF